MKKLIIIFPIFLFLIAAAPTPLTGKIVGVSDGDTVTLLTADNQQVKIRLSEIDCPEKNQAFGQRAKQFTSELVFGKTVSVKFHDHDRYGRTVGEIILPDGRSLNTELVRNGFAWHYKQYSSNQELTKLEIEARTAKKGLWADQSPTPPWDFRRGNRQGQQHQKEVQSSPAQQKKTISFPASYPPASEQTVLYNTRSRKIHCPNCSGVSQCTNCVPMSAAKARNRGGVPCKICGGCL